MGFLLKIKSFYFLNIFFVIVLVTQNFINYNSINNSFIFTSSFENKQIISDDNFSIQNNTSYKILQVPYEDMMYDLNFGDAAACLSMLSQYYKCWVSKQEIQTIVNPSYPSEGISMDGFLNATTYDNYSVRKFGFYPEIFSLKDLTYEERWDFIKSYIDQGIPLIIICKQYPVYPTHHRIITGYDDRLEIIYLNDPWLGAAPYYTGPKCSMSIKAGSWLSTTWSYTEYQIAIVRPIHINLSIINKSLAQPSNFILKCFIDTTFLNQKKDLTIQLDTPNDYTLITGQKNILKTGVDNDLTLTWNISCSTPSLNDKIKVNVTALNSGKILGGYDFIYPQHPKITISNFTSDQINDTTFYRPNLTATIENDSNFNVSLVCFSSAVAAQMDCDNSTFQVNISSIQPYTISCSIGPFQPRKIVFSMLVILTNFSITFSSILILKIIASDLDSDGLNDFDEEVIYQTSPLNNDTDHDDLNDYDEVKVYFTNPISEDTDGEGLKDGEEVFIYNTNPLLEDTDGDSMTDYDEIINGFDPLDPKSNLEHKRNTMLISIIVPITSITLISLIIYFLIKKVKTKS